MRRSLMAAALIVTTLSPLSAQWPSHQAPGAPKTSDGKVDLSAPAPRTADGKPDISGIWMSRAFGPSVPGRPPIANFGHAGIGFKEDLPFQPWARELQKKRASEFSKENPDGLCLPESLLQLHLDPQPLKVVQTPAAIYIIYETNYGLRTIFTDGRALPAAGRAAAGLVRLLGWPMGRRHAGRGDEQLPRRRLARCARQPDDRGGHGDRAVPARQLRTARHRIHARRSEGLHAALHGQDRSASHRRRLGADRIHLPREPAVPEEGESRLVVRPSQLTTGRSVVAAEKSLSRLVVTGTLPVDTVH